MPKEKMPELDQEATHQIMHMAMFTAKIRSTVMKNKYNQEQLVPVFREVGTRLSKIYKKLAWGLCIYFDKVRVDEQVLKILRTICIDTCPSLQSLFILEMFKESQQNDQQYCTTSNLHSLIGVGRSTIQRVRTDFEVSNFITLVKGEQRVQSKFKISEDLRRHILDAKLATIKPQSKFYWKPKKEAEAS